MDDFYPLTVTDIEQTTRDAVVLTLLPRAEDEGRFGFRPGQYLTFRRDFAGADVRRSYSICSAGNESALKVGVKHVKGGAFSGFANGALKVGDVLEVMPPMGRFSPPERASGHHYIGIAAGSGVTPLLSIIATVLARDPAAQFTFIYGNRSVSAIMFRGELGALKDRFLNRLSIVHVLSGEAQDIELFSGRIDGAKIAALTAAGWIAPEVADLAFICGPEEMMHATRGALETAGMAPEQIKFELFTAAQPGRAVLKADADAARAAGEMVKLTVIVDGAPHSFEMPRRGQSVLEAAQAQSLGAPFSCQAGVCATCKGRVVSGEVEMLQNYALEDYEVEQGYVLTCQSYPLTDKVVIEYEGH